MTELPNRFAVWESHEFPTGVVQICNREYLEYGRDEFLRIYPEREPQHLPAQPYRGRILIQHWNNARPTYGRARVQLAHNQTQLIYYVITDFFVQPFNLHTGQQIDEELPLILVFGDYMYGTGRPLHNYSFELVDAYRYRHLIEEIYNTFLDAYNLPPLYHQPAVPRLERRRRRPTPTPDELVELRAPLPPPQPPLTRPTERIALAIARDFQRQGELCPITQEALRAGDISVTGCLCVFQADALQSWARGHHTCPSCRKQLIYRTVTVGSEENVMIGL